MKHLRLFSFGLASLLALGNAHAEPPTVHLYNWSDFLAPETAKEFQAATGTTLVQDVFDDAEVMESKLMAGRSGYDVVIIPDDLIPNFAKAGVLQELDRSQLGNWPHLDAEVLRKLQVNDPGNRYAVPYMWGTTGIGYNLDKVAQRLGPDAPVDSWDLIFKKENISKLSACGVAMLDAPVEIIPIALHYLGLPPNSKNPDDYKKAEALLRDIRPYVRYFDSSKFPSDLANGNICAVVGWGGSVYGAKQTAERAHNGIRIAYSIPRQGAPVWVNNMVLLKDAPHPQQGYAFMDYILRPEITARNSNYVGYPNGNKDATALIDAQLRDNPALYPSKEVMSTLYPLETLPLRLERVRTRMWTRIKTGT
ncbi:MULTISPECIES: polyamine ABC transporter substrate-binding protein [Pseudomonas aeruginosa group]|uniref:polyamine ABC transporter substrate-binding protein n=1 Tax=Pseudomonas aeruginosa group TaxID=136841 RepID=UPI0003B9F0B4|nr:MULTISPECIES: polyamine ABC transporter substrate-binding protein [Pseudomonas aeruginosa group]ESR68053.1 ABC transporter substrate-binding protein [Pseudomonas aeruginosa VRFPA05]QFZ64063.1 polyamine ABC transporter substrate-binding protein [Pseudomonas aeruginosa PA99]ALV79092.1 Putrescine-binding periplasmic protein precursor [Pseudomonas aeruginosa]EIU1420161.1 polyamine ABC transporter substrate-binding protein [Pseudomonas aeruginosa]EIU4875702.1 polyamine ABC transporter substrate-